MKIKQQVKNIVEKRRMLLRSNFSSFHNIFNISLTSRVQLHIYARIFVKCGCANYFILNSANLICRGTDISKYFRESLGIRDNESRLYLLYRKATSVEFSLHIICIFANVLASIDCFVLL